MVLGFTYCFKFCFFFFYLIFFLQICLFVLSNCFFFIWCFGLLLFFYCVFRMDHKWSSQNILPTWAQSSALCTVDSYRLWFSGRQTSALRRAVRPVWRISSQSPIRQRPVVSLGKRSKSDEMIEIWKIKIYSLSRQSTSIGHLLPLSFHWIQRKQRAIPEMEGE